MILSKICIRHCPSAYPSGWRWINKIISKIFSFWVPIWNPYNDCKVCIRSVHFFCHSNPYTDSLQQHSTSVAARRDDRRAMCAAGQARRSHSPPEVANFEKKLSSFIPMEDAPCITDVWYYYYYWEIATILLLRVTSLQQLSLAEFIGE